MKTISFLRLTSQLLVVLCFCTSPACSQSENRFIDLYGKIEHQGHPVQDFDIVLISRSNVPDTIPGSESFSLLLPVNEVFGIVIAKEGYVNEVILIDTELPTDKLVTAPFYAHLELLSDNDAKDIPAQYLGLPFGTIQFEEEQDSFWINQYSIAESRRDFLSLLRFHGLAHKAFSEYIGLAAKEDLE